MYGKVKGTVPKLILTEEDDNHTEQVILPVMRRMANIVGSTLGPGGRPVLLERQEDGLPPILTKDGVTVARALGFANVAQDNVARVALDVAIRTANEAGDGTTTATVLAHALIEATHAFCKGHPQASPQGVIRRLAEMFQSDMEPVLLADSVAASPATPEGLKLLHAVARISANGDQALADAVIECLKVIGDEGNVTIIEASGPTGYRVEPLRGYPVAMGYDESCRRFYDKFINDQGHQRCVVENPSFLLYHGQINDINAIRGPMEKVSELWEKKVVEIRGGAHPRASHVFRPVSPNVVIVATGFSDNVLGQLALNFHEGGMKVVPLLVPLSPIANGQIQLLHDLAAVTGATIMDQVNKPLDAFHPDYLGPGVDSFEMLRFRSNIIGMARGMAHGVPSADNSNVEWITFEDLLMARVKQVQIQAQQAASAQDGILLRERLAKLTAGIAQLIISGASNGELKERHDRAEDAVCAVRGAIKHGCLPGGGWGLTRVALALVQRYFDFDNLDTQIVQRVLLPALEAPIRKLLKNAGRPKAEIDDILGTLAVNVSEGVRHFDVFDAAAGRWVDAWEAGLLDSTPAVVEAIRSAISMSQLGALGGSVSFYRDGDLERQDAAAKAEFLRTVNSNPANERP